jgi:8-oxo-dGTP pyrophosphatase MutT (NUDIX family)
VLLIRTDPPETEPHWSGPGGGIEAGEAPVAALLRELAEEVAPRLEVRLVPVGDWRHVFRRRGHLVVQHEQLWTAVLPVGTDPLVLGPGPEAAADHVTELRWFSAADVEACPEAVWPEGLSDWLG